MVGRAAAAAQNVLRRQSQNAGYGCMYLPYNMYTAKRRRSMTEPIRRETQEARRGGRPHRQQNHNLAKEERNGFRRNGAGRQRRGKAQPPTRAILRYFFGQSLRTLLLHGGCVSTWTPRHAGPAVHSKEGRTPSPLWFPFFGRRCASFSQPTNHWQRDGMASNTTPSPENEVAIP